VNESSGAPRYLGNSRNWKKATSGSPGSGKTLSSTTKGILKRSTSVSAQMSLLELTEEVVIQKRSMSESGVELSTYALHLKENGFVKAGLD